MQSGNVRRVGHTSRYSVVLLINSVFPTTGMGTPGGAQELSRGDLELLQITKKLSAFEYHVQRKTILKNITVKTYDFECILLYSAFKTFLLIQF